MCAGFIIREPAFCHCAAVVDAGEKIIICFRAEFCCTLCVLPVLCNAGIASLRINRAGLIDECEFFNGCF